MVGLGIIFLAGVLTAGGGNTVPPVTWIEVPATTDWCRPQAVGAGKWHCFGMDARRRKKNSQ
jgi:hypothetical protein